MISKRENYNYLLDNLREVTEEYYTKKDINEEVYSTSIVMFSQLYCLAYRYKNGIVGQVSNDKKNEFAYYALNDYNTFNSFINNCVNEYRMYNELGTGKVLYVPYQELADFFFSDNYYKSVLTNYLRSELEELITIDEEKKNSK